MRHIRLTLKRLVVLVGLTVTALFLAILSIRHYMSTNSDIIITKADLQNIDPNIVTQVSISIMKTFKGYPAPRISKKAYPLDDALLEKLLRAQNLLKFPRFTLKTTQMPHTWKFDRIIHQTWISEKIPGRTVVWVKKWLKLNPDWTYMYWTDKSSRLFIQDHFLSLLPIYDSWTLPVQKADMFRYIALYAFGGIYGDLDMEIHRPLEDIRQWGSCVLSREPDVQTHIMDLKASLLGYGNNHTLTCNAFMACRAHHPFLYLLLSRLVQQSPYVLKRPCSRDSTIGCTGPILLSLTYAFYRRSIGDNTLDSKPELDVICPDYEWFLPTADPSRMHIVRSRCNNLLRLTKKQRIVCKVFEHRGRKNVPFPYSYTQHHWFSSYHNNVNVNVVDINTVTENLQWNNDNQHEYFHIEYVGAETLGTGTRSGIDDNGVADTNDLPRIPSRPTRTVI